MEWKEFQISEIATLINGRAYSQDELFEKGKYKIVRVGNLSGGDKWFFSDMELDADKYCYPNDLLFSWACNFGPHIWKNDKTIYHYHIWKVKEDSSKIDKYFFYYFLKYRTPYWLGNVNGSVMVHITKGTMEKQSIRIPVNLSDQRKIAGILSALDAKIENNNKINANLEAQAEALFKSWFVDFTPFKDQPFVDSELGPIPQGWKVVSLDEVCLKITDGSHFSPKDNPKEKIPMLSVKDMRKHGFDYQSCKHITESDFFKLQKNDCVPHVNDLLVAKDGSYLKEIFLCKKEIKQAILSSIAIFRPNTKLILPEYLLHYLKQPQVLKDVRDNYVSGSAVPRIVLKDFKKLKLCIPPMNSISTYRELLKSIEKLLLQKTEENQRLAALRDTLLPKLMSGEIKL